MMKRRKGGEAAIGNSSCVVVEDDGDIGTSNGSSSSFRPQQPQQPILASKILPTTTTLIQRPIATRPSELFYNATETAKIPFHTVHAAVQETNAWENVWINRMNEVNPLLLSSTSNSRRSISGEGGGDTTTATDEDDDDIWNAAIAIIERDRGARNPSPTDHRAMLKRTLPAPVVAVVVGDDSRIEYPQQQQQQQYYHRPPVAPVATQLVRPKAMRVDAVMEPPKPPAAPTNTEIMTNNSNVWMIPHEIKSQTARSLSPITTKSDDTSSSTTSGGPSQSSNRLLLRRDGPSSTEMNVIYDDDDDEDYCVAFPQRMMTLVAKPRAATAEVVQAREGLLYQLAIGGGETTSPLFLDYLSILQNSHRTKIDTEYNSNDCNDNSANPFSVHEGTWLTLTKPTFFGCLGENDAGDPLYTLGRMTFDMFTPCDLVCSLQGNFNTVHPVTSVPEGLVAQVGTDPSVLRTYHIVTAFTIEPTLAAYPDAPNKTVHRPIRGLLTTTGYMMTDTSDPEEHRNQRNSLWITGGTMEPNDTPHDTMAWKSLFGNVPPRTMGANAKLLAMKWLLGAVVDDVMDKTTGALQYTFTKPIGGQGKAYSDTLYADSSLRIIRGHRGTLFVFSKQPDCQL